MDHTDSCNIYARSLSEAQKQWLDAIELMRYAGDLLNLWQEGKAAYPTRTTGFGRKRRHLSGAARLIIASVHGRAGIRGVIPEAHDLSDAPAAELRGLIDACPVAGIWSLDGENVCFHGGVHRDGLERWLNPLYLRDGGCFLPSSCDEQSIQVENAQDITQLLPVMFYMSDILSAVQGRALNGNDASLFRIIGHSYWRAAAYSLFLRMLYPVCRKAFIEIGLSHLKVLANEAYKGLGEDCDCGIRIDQSASIPFARLFLKRCLISGVWEMDGSKSLVLLNSPYRGHFINRYKALGLPPCRWE